MRHILEIIKKEKRRDILNLLKYTLSKVRKWFNELPNYSTAVNLFLLQNSYKYISFSFFFFLYLEIFLFTYHEECVEQKSEEKSFHFFSILIRHTHSFVDIIALACLSLIIHTVTYYLIHIYNRP